MKKNTKIENILYEIGQTMDLKKEEIKTTLKNKKGPIVMGIFFLAAITLMGNFATLGARYKGITPLDFLGVLFDKFPFSFLF